MVRAVQTRKERERLLEEYKRNPEKFKQETVDMLKKLLEMKDDKTGTDNK